MMPGSKGQKALCEAMKQYVASVGGKIPFDPNIIKISRNR
jgi:hypothetical protein